MVTFLAKRLFDTTKAAQAGNAGIPFKKVLDEAKFLSLPRAKVNGGSRGRRRDRSRDVYHTYTHPTWRVAFLARLLDNEKRGCQYRTIPNDASLLQKRRSRRDISSNADRFNTDTIPAAEIYIEHGKSAPGSV